MHSWFDKLAKAILSALIRPHAAIETEHEIVGHALSADVWVQPAPGQADDLAQLGILGRMLAHGPCIIEPFSQTPRPREIRTCICKQYSLSHAQTRQARRDKRPEPAFPTLWIISPGRPETMLDEAGCQAMDGWPTGFWQRTTWDAFHVVTINALPRTPETLPLRLLGRRQTLFEAIHELGGLPQDAWPKRLLVPVLVAFRAQMSQDPEEEEVMQAIQEIDAIYEQWEKRVKDQGREDNQRAVLRRLLTQRFGELPGHVRQRIQGADMDQLQRWTERVIPASSLADVFE